MTYVADQRPCLPASPARLRRARTICFLARVTDAFVTRFGGGGSSPRTRCAIASMPVEFFCFRRASLRLRRAAFRRFSVALSVAIGVSTADGSV